MKVFISCSGESSKRSAQSFRRYLTDDEIALRIGHKSRGKLIVEVYGKISDDRISFLPEKRPVAWQKFLRGRPVQLDLGL